MLSIPRFKEVFGFSPIVEGERWRLAYILALANAVVFLILAIGLFLLKPTSLMAILSAPALFSIGSLLSFLVMVRGGGACAAIAWFVLGSGVFFGLGVVVGGVLPNPVSAQADSELVLWRDLLRCNLLNASSVFIVLATAYPLANIRGSKIAPHVTVEELTKGVIGKLFPLVLFAALVGVVLEYVLFPFAENLVVRSLVSAFYLAIPLCLFLLGMLWQLLDWRLRLAGGSVVFLELLNGIINFNKWQIISALLAVVVGTWVTRHRLGYVAMTLLMTAAIFVVTYPLVSSGRGHVDYHPTANTVTTRVGILADVVFGGSKIGSIGSQAVTPSLRRFSVPFIQGYLIAEYENGRGGKSLDDFWAAMVPRVLWPDKPIITRFGPELYAQYYNQPPTSALAPTYTAEAYWNYGILGVVLVSILLGLEFGWLTRRSQLALAGNDPAFFLIAAPITMWAMHVETWVAASYIGGFMRFFVIWFIAYLALRIYRSMAVRQ